MFEPNKDGVNGDLRISHNENLYRSPGTARAVKLRWYNGLDT
jgi:hypothetical protein